MKTLTEAERLRAWILINRLQQQLNENVEIAIPNVGPDPQPIGKLYFKRHEIYNRIVKKMREMAPDGVSSQHQFIEILEQAINTVNDELKREMAPDDMANIVLSINDVERALMFTELMFTPYQSLNLNETKGEMGKKYAWKEDLMKLVQERLREYGKPDDNMEDVIEKVKPVIASEVSNTLDMIYNTLRMIPAAIFFSK